MLTLIYFFTPRLKVVCLYYIYIYIYFFFFQNSIRLLTPILQSSGFFILFYFLFYHYYNSYVYIRVVVTSKCVGKFLYETVS